jgi:hypothetical protein
MARSSSRTPSRLRSSCGSEISLPGSGRTQASRCACGPLGKPVAPSQLMMPLAVKPRQTAAMTQTVVEDFRSTRRPLISFSQPRADTPRPGMLDTCPRATPAAENCFWMLRYSRVVTGILRRSDRQMTVECLILAVVHDVQRASNFSVGRSTSCMSRGNCKMEVAKNMVLFRHGGGSSTHTSLCLIRLISTCGSNLWKPGGISNRGADCGPS